jgi:hypothetical protein
VVNSADLAAAVELARAAAGVDAETPASTVVVRRLDRGGEYALVRLGAPGSAGWIAAVNVAEHDVMSWAANPSGESTVPEADPAEQGTEYVWRPSGVSRSPLYPLLRLTTDTGERFVDLSGRSFTELR